MQTFLPYADFTASVRSLDYRRLGKQRVECAQLIKAIESGGGWSVHPCAHMWTGYVPALKAYMDEAVKEWVSRDYKNNYELNYPEGPPVDLKMPPWLGDPELHKSHRISLLRKSDYYDTHEWEEMTAENIDWFVPVDQVYWWPRLTADSYELKKKGDY